MKTMSIDFIRQVIEQTLEEEHEKNYDYFGGKNQVNLFSFYEQLQEDYEVDRYTEVYRDLVDEQNRTGLIMNGTIVAPENPQMMNLNSATIIPMVFTCSFRVALKDRDQAINTIDNLFKVLRGRKRDIACFESGKLFVVGTMLNEVLGNPKITDNVFLGNITNIGDQLTSQILSRTSEISSMFGGAISFSATQYYISNSGKLYHVIYDSENLIWKIDTDFEYSGQSFDKYKLSLSFDTIRIDEPKTLNAQEYCTISFGGSATLVDEKVMLGNDLTKLGISKYKIIADTDVTFTEQTYWLEPLEMPNGLGISSELSQLASHDFIQGKHNDGINPTFDYSFVLDKSNELIKQWWKYSRYGIIGTPTQSFTEGVTPNVLYKIVEIWSSWGEIERYEFKAKATENIDIENTESDALTLKIKFELQKE